MINFESYLICVSYNVNPFIAFTKVNDQNSCVASLGVNSIKAGKYTQEGLKREESTEENQGKENNDGKSLTEGGGKR